MKRESSIFEKDWLVNREGRLAQKSEEICRFDFILNKFIQADATHQGMLLSIQKCDHR